MHTSNLKHRRSKNCWSNKSKQSRYFGISILIGILVLIGCDKQIDLSRQEPPSDFPRLFGLSDGPNEMLFRWKYCAAETHTKTQVDKGGQNDVIIIDSRSSFNSLRQNEFLALCSEVKWLRIQDVPDRFSPQWIEALTSVRGVSWCGAELANVEDKLFDFPKSLEWLNLSNSKLNREALSSVASLPDLEVLLLANTIVNPNELKRTQWAGSLRVLDLSWSKVADEDLNSILKQNPDLHVLVLTGCKALSSKAIDSISKLNELQFLAANDSGLANGDYLDSARRIKKNHPGCYMIFWD